jgi:hypothetical protein
MILFRILFRIGCFCPEISRSPLSFYGREDHQAPAFNHIKFRCIVAIKSENTQPPPPQPPVNGGGQPKNPYPITTNHQPTTNNQQLNLLKLNLTKVNIYSKFDLMTCLPLSAAIAHNLHHHIRLVATDFDSTVTKCGKITADLLQSLTDLANAGLPVLIVTGRSAGWVNGLATYLPVIGAIAENGGVFFSHRETDPPVILSAIADLSEHKLKLAQTFASLQEEFPQLQVSFDNQFRLTDWTFDVSGLSHEDLQKINHCCQQAGWGFTYSSIQCHIKPPAQEKATALQKLLSLQFPEYAPKEVLTVGDSPNDESLFNPALFPLSVGVANLREYLPRLTHTPTYMTQEKEVDGFRELVRCLTQYS